MSAACSFFCDGNRTPKGNTWHGRSGDRELAMTRKATTVDEYLSNVSGDKRTALDKLRRTIRSIVPKAEECISYGIPAFRLGGTVVAGFCATAKGCSYFPFSGSTLGTLARDLEGYGGTKSALHFDPRKPLPTSLVRKLIKARIAETESGAQVARLQSRRKRR